MTGAWIGLLLGMVSFALLRHVAGKMENARPSDDQKRSAAVIRIAALAELIVFPAIGYVIGPMVLDA
jgi:hypothetical protein